MAKLIRTKAAKQRIKNLKTRQLKAHKEFKQKYSSAKTFSDVFKLAAGTGGFSAVGIQKNKLVKVGRKQVAISSRALARTAGAGKVQFLQVANFQEDNSDSVFSISKFNREIARFYRKGFDLEGIAGQNISAFKCLKKTFQRELIDTTKIEAAQVLANKNLRITRDGDEEYNPGDSDISSDPKDYPGLDPKTGFQNLTKKQLEAYMLRKLKIKFTSKGLKKHMFKDSGKCEGSFESNKKFNKIRSRAVKESEKYDAVESARDKIITRNILSENEKSSTKFIEDNAGVINRARAGTATKTELNKFHSDRKILQQQQVDTYKNRIWTIDSNGQKIAQQRITYYTNQGEGKYFTKYKENIVKTLKTIFKKSLRY